MPTLKYSFAKFSLHFGYGKFLSQETEQNVTERNRTYQFNSPHLRIAPSSQILIYCYCLSIQQAQARKMYLYCFAQPAIGRRAVRDRVTHFCKIQNDKFMRPATSKSCKNLRGENIWFQEHFLSSMDQVAQKKCWVNSPQWKTTQLIKLWSSAIFIIINYLHNIWELNKKRLKNAMLNQGWSWLELTSSIVVFAKLTQHLPKNQTTTPLVQK